MKGRPQNLIACLSVALISAGIAPQGTVAQSGDLVWKAEYFPSFSDAHTVALWLFDETEYAFNTLTDAGIYEYDLRLFDGHLVSGRFGSALKASAAPGYNLYYAEWVGKVMQAQMRRPDGEPSGHWGPTLPPEKLLAALANQDWTLEFWVRGSSRPCGDAMVVDLGQAFEPGFCISLDAESARFRVRNFYGGHQSNCPTMTDKLFDGEWHHVAFSWSRSAQRMTHYVDGRAQPNPTLSSVAPQAVPQVLIPSSFVRPDGYDVFDKSGDEEKFRRHRFNLAMAEDRHGIRDLEVILDEFRVSNVVRYSEDFDPPRSFSRNHAPRAPRPTAANGQRLLFAPESPRDVIRLGSRKHVFIDDSLLESKQGVELTCHPPRHREVLNFRPIDSRWRPSVVDVDGKVFMFIPESYGSDEGHTRLRISEDGLHFRTPNLGLYEYRGSTGNDFIVSYKPLYADFFKDLNPSAHGEEQYKMTAWLSNRGIYLYVSPDGIHWRRNETAMLPIKSGGDAETYWDDQRGVYVTLIRRDSSNYTKEHPGRGRAGVYFETNDVFRTWPFKRLDKPYYEAFPIPTPTGEGVTLFKENESGQVYRTRAIKYPWAPDTYVCFVWRFDADDETRRVDLGVSRDGLHWEFFADRTWYITPPDAAAEVLSMYGLIRRGDQIWQYIDYGGPHGAGARTYARVTQRLDGFVSVTAGKQTGDAVTRPLIFQGKHLELNIAVDGMGSVEIQDEQRKPIRGFALKDCDPIRANEIRHLVRWKGNGDLSPLAGKVVRVRFELRDARLFAMQFVEAN